MAWSDLTIDEINTVSSKYYDKGIKQQVYEESPLVQKLKAKKNLSAQSGTQVQFGIRARKLGQAGSVNPRERITYLQKETRTAAVLDWKYYVGKTMMQWDEYVKNSSGKAQIINLLAEKSKELTEDIQDKLDDELYATSQGSDSFSSLDTIIDSSTTYAGISVSNAAAWKSTEDTTTTKLVLYGSSTSLAHQFNLTTFGKERPSLVITTRDLKDKIESLIEPQKRYSNGDLGKIGFDTINFKGSEVVGDYNCPTGYLFGIDIDNWEIVYNGKAGFVVDPWVSLVQAGFPRATVKIATCVMNIICKLRKTNFKYTALNYDE